MTGERRGQGAVLNEDDKARRFREVALPHLDAAFNLARWLTRNDDHAQDVVQEAYLRAFRYFDGFKGGDARAWVLRIVRHSSYDWLQTIGARRELLASDTPDADEDGAVFDAIIGSTADDPEIMLCRQQDAALLNTLIERLPAEFREVLVLREIEALSYREIAEVTSLPIGTVMSRLSRARAQLRAAWRRARPEGGDDGL